MLQANREFIELARKNGLLSETAAQELEQAISGDDEVTSASQLAIARGLLTAVDVDIVHALQRPTKIAPGYEIIGLIGRGAMGVVYRAKQIDLEKIVALKTILIGVKDRDASIRRFRREAKSLAQLQHPNIVQALSFGEHHGRFFLAMELAEGRTAAEASQAEGTLPSEFVWSIVRQVAAGLLHALHQNIIHRDVKPSNLILISPPEGSLSGVEVAKIADFGLANVAEVDENYHDTSAGQLTGSPMFMSPEQFESRQIDFRSDMYSLGVTAWLLRFGSPPFEGKSIAEIYRRKMEPFHPDPKQLPLHIPMPELQLLCSMLESDPKKRPQSYEFLINAIDELSLVRIEKGVTRIDSPRRPRADEKTNLSATVERPFAATMVTGSPKNIPRARNRRRIFSAIAALLLAMIVIVAVMKSWRTAPLRNHTVAVAEQTLFDGITLTGWSVDGTMVGSWNTVEAPDHSNAIACTVARGAITRRLPSLVNPQQLPRIQIFVWMTDESGPVDIDFGFDTTTPDSTRGTLRMTDQANQLGYKTSDFGELRMLSESKSHPSLHERYQVVHLEKQSDDWFVFVEEEFVGTLPTQQIDSDDAIRIVVHSSNAQKPTAFFAEVELFALSEPPE